MKLRWILLVVVLIMAIALALKLMGDINPTTPAYYENVKRIFPAVVRVIAGNTIGSGVIVTKDGYVLTCQHIVGTNKTVTVLLNSGDNYQGVVITTDLTEDLAIIKLPTSDAGYTYASLGDSNESEALQIGSPVLVIGYPAGNDIKNLSLSTGVLCSFSRIQSVSYLQSDAKVSGGMGGGPMTNKAGEVIGIINSAYTNMENRCATFATTANEAKALLDQVGQEKSQTTPSNPPATK